MCVRGDVCSDYSIGLRTVQQGYSCGASPQTVAEVSRASGAAQGVEAEAWRAKRKGRNHDGQA